jgi:DNA-directed RNA polymerase omega subunit
MAEKLSLEEIDKLTRNRYEAVLIAAQRARQINSLRLALLERMTEEDVSIDARKVTTIALRDIIDGNIELKRFGENENPDR